MRNTVLGAFGVSLVFTTAALLVGYSLVSKGLVKLPSVGAARHAAAAPAPEMKKIFVAGVLSGVHVVDLKTGRQLKKIDTGVLPHNFALSKDSKRLYVTNVGSQSVSEIDTETLAHIKDILVGEIPDNPSHRKVAPEKLKAATSCVGCHYFTAMGTLPNAIAWAPDEKHLLVNETLGRSLTVLDPESGKTVERHRFELPTPSFPANFVVHPDSKELWVLHRFEAETYKEKSSKPTGRTATMNDFSHDPPAGQKTSWVTVHSPDLKTELARIKMDWAVPFGAVFSPDGRWLYVAYRSSDQIAVFDTHAKKFVRSFKAGVAPTGLALTPDGKTLYVTCHFSVPAIVQAIDVRSGEIIVSMGIPPSPSLVVQDRRSGFIYVTVTGYNAILEIDPVSQRLVRELTAGHQPLDLVLTP